MIDVTVFNLVDFIFNAYGFHVFLGIELEFYASNDLHDNIIENIETLFGYEIVNETSEYQYELRTKPSLDVINLLENLNSAKERIVVLAKTFNSEIFFDAKPFPEKSSNAMHINISLLDANYENKFVYSNGKPNEILGYAIGGLCKTMKNSMSVFAPNENSYLRFSDSSIHVPKTISWGRNNRSAAIRIPVSGETRLEHRVPCSDSDPFLVVGEILFGIIVGLHKKIDPPAQTYGVASDVIYNLERFPITKNEALVYSTKFSEITMNIVAL